MPIVVGVGVLALTTLIIARVFFFGKKKKAPITLNDPAVKYHLKLVDKEVGF